MIRSAIVGRAEVLLAGVLLVGIAAAQTNNSEAQSPAKSVYAELAKVPAKAAGRHNPLEADPEALAAGAKVGSSRVDLQACKLEYSIVSPK